MAHRLVTIVCYSIGMVSLLVNIICLSLIRKTRNIYSSKIFTVMLYLQIIYTFQNFHFTIICDVLLANLCGLFFLLLFVRHQSLLRLESSILKFSSKVQRVIKISFMICVNILPVRMCFAHLTSSPRNRQQSILRICPSCDWVRSKRNFGVIPSVDADVS
ncbi:hypothetical protein PENTCL1PPCAC_16703, partial [Pristionchus entomophagus]